MKRDHFVLAMFLVVAFSLISSRPVTAAVVPSGDVYPSNPTDWTFITDAFIGMSGIGSVSVNDASTIESSYSYLGRGPDAIGTMTVSDANSTWTIWDNLYVGDQGDGTLEIQNGAIVNNWDNSYIAYAGGSTGQVTVDGDGSLWAHVNSLYVGRGGHAALSVTGGATVNNSHGIIADSSPGLLNQVTVSGSGSTWTNRSALYVGYSGDAALDVLNGGKVESATGFIAGYYDASGTMTIDGTGSTWDNAGDLIIGYEDANTGTLSLTGGGSLTNGQNLYVGYLGKGTLSVGAGSTVTNTGIGYISYKTPEYVISYPWSEDHTDEVTVSGAGAAWNNGDDLYVGYESKATLEVTAGGTVTNTVGYIGNTGNGRGEVTVSGADSTWTNSDNLYVGYHNHGKLDIACGAAVENKQGYIGYYSSGCEATVDGDSSTWTNSSNLTVGYGGNGSLDITGGGSVSNHTGTIATGSSSSGNVTVDGQDSTWTSHGTLTVGSTGHGTLDITNQGAVVCDGYATIANMAAATGQVTVDGSGSSLTISGDKITIGNYGQGTLQITGGADVSCKSGSIAAQKNSIGSVTVRGAGSTFTVEKYDLKVGGGGDGTLLVDQQATLTSGSTTYDYDDAIIGGGASATGLATIDGAGSSWTHHGDLYVANNGIGTLAITNNSTVTIDEATYVGYEAYATGAINFGTSGGTLSTRSLCVSPNQVSGTGTIETRGLISDVALTFDSSASLTQTVTLGGIAVNLDLATNPATNGYLGAGWRGTGSMTISDGTTVQSDNGYLGYVAGSHGTATVTGAGSTWTNGGNTSVHLYVGYHSNGTLSITDGGTVAYCDSYIGCENGSIGTATVDGDDSTWTSSRYLHVGHDGHGTLYVNNGGGASCNYCNVENGSVFVNGKSSTTGTASSLTTGSTGSITVGDGLLKITNGGDVNSYRGTIGHWTNETGRVAVDGTDSTWTMGETFYVADYGTATVAITNGGTVSNSYGKIAGRTSGTGTVTVSGTSSTWTNSGKLYVGEVGTARVEINDGGTISNTDGYIAYGSSAVGTVLVTGTNSTWTNSGSLAIGTDGEARLVITDGGNVSATSASINSLSLLAIEVNDGSLFDVGSTGTFTNGGMVRVIAGPMPTAGSAYSPIAAGTWDGSGTCQAVGGTWSSTAHMLTSSVVVNGSSGTAVLLDLSAQQRVLIDDGGNASIDWTVGVSFLAADTATSIDFTATVIDGQVLADLQDHLDSGDVVLAAWDFDAPDYGEGDPAYISFDVGPGCPRDDVQIWQYDEEEEMWSQYETWDLTYDGTYVSFTPDEFSVFAVTPFKNDWIPGDCDGDNRVDEEDAATLAANWCEEGRWADGDFNDDGIVNAIDASIMAANWGDWTTSSEQGNPSVPEPGMVVLLFGIAFFTLQRMSTHRQ